MIRASAHHAFRKAPTTMVLRSARIATFSSSSSLIPERNLWDTIYSGTKGLISLLVSEESRQKFMNIVQGSTINADVLKQARFGSMLTIALFHDLQDPLFKKYSFNASDFLTGVKPALANFHDTLGQLQNEFPEISSKEEQHELLMERFRQIATIQMNAAPESPWTTQAQNDPESAAGRLNTMVSPRLFNSLFLTTETEAMMSKYKENSTKVSYVALLSARAFVMDEEEFGTAGTDDDKDPTINTTKGESLEAEPKAVDAKEDNNEKIDEVVKMESSADDKDANETSKDKEEEKVVKWGALQDEKKETEEIVKMESTTDDKDCKEKEEEHVLKLEPVNDEVSEGADKAAATEGEELDDSTPVAAQIEVLYEMNQTVDIKPIIFAGPEGEEKTLPPDGTATKKDETQIWVGTFEGWLNGGPDGTLRWRITHLRPPHAEFPNLYHRLQRG